MRSAWCVVRWMDLQPATCNSQILEQRRATMNTSTVWTLAEKELRDALHNRWFVLYTVAFIGLSLAFSYLSLAGAGIVGFAGFGRTAASLINLVLLIVPLMALTVGAQSLAGEQERSTLAYLLAQPINRVEVFIGKYLGLSLSLLASLALGFGISGLVMALNGGGASDPAAYIRLVWQTFLLSLTMLSIGFLVSALSKRAGVADLCLSRRFGLDGDCDHHAGAHRDALLVFADEPITGLQTGGDSQYQHIAGYPRPCRNLRHAGIWRRSGSDSLCGLGAVDSLASPGGLCGFCQQE